MLCLASAHHAQSFRCLNSTDNLYVLSLVSLQTAAKWLQLEVLAKYVFEFLDNKFVENKLVFDKAQYLVGFTSCMCSHVRRWRMHAIAFCNDMSAHSLQRITIPTRTCLCSVTRNWTCS